MKKQVLPSVFMFLFLCVGMKAQTCNPNDEPLIGTAPPEGQCNQDNGADCCVEGEKYTTYSCSPPVLGNTAAILTLNSFQEGGDGGGPSKCDGKFYSDDKLVVALSTGWFGQKTRCNQYININGNNGNSVSAMVVDECDSQSGCNEEHSYQPPCRYNIVDASKAVWEKLGIDPGPGEASITWSDATN